MNTNETLTVTVLSPQATLYTGSAQSVSSTNSAGNFDLLPEHANFITIVENHPITVVTDAGQKKSFVFPIAIIHITNNQVKVYAQLPTQAVN